MARNLVTIVLLLALAIIYFSCQVTVHVHEQPNIVWITSEDNSKHYMQLFDKNGVPTPHIKSLSDHGLIFTHAFSNAPVCSVARSTLISGCYAPRIGSQFHRKLKMVPMPDSLRMFPAYLREAGYYTSNNRKEDYNIIKTGDVWDESSATASWTNRQADQPFFHVQNFTTTHESRLHFTQAQMDSIITKTPEETVKVLPNHPETPIFRFTNAYYRDKIIEMDQQVGEVIDELEREGLLESTFIFYFGDHGGVLPGSKGYLYETGLHIPLVVHIPDQYQHLVEMKPGSTMPGFVSFVDFGPTVLNLAGIQVPEGMDGVPFLGAGVGSTEVNARDEAWGYADRFDEKYDLVRSLRKGDYKYIRSFQPFNYDGLMNNYRYIQLAYQEWLGLYQAGKLNQDQSRFFTARPTELLFDLEKDPYETKNLASDPAHQEKLTALRTRLNEWMGGLPDLSLYPEHYLVENAWYNPVEFGLKHKTQINAYLTTTHLAFQAYDDASLQLSKKLDSADPWQRYWALVVSSTFGEQAKSLSPTIMRIAESDPVLINRIRAAEALTMMHLDLESQLILNALYACTDPGEALLILNSVVLLRDGHGKDFHIQPENLSEMVREDSQVQRRLKYLSIP